MKTLKLRFVFGVFVGLLVAPFNFADTGPSIITDNVVEITEYTSPNGFKHPGIRFTKPSLENLRTQVIAGQEPWASYFEGMRRLSWASLNYVSANDNGSGYPRNPIIDNNGKIANFIQDAQAALIHSVMYYVTGNEQHRAVAMRMLSIYSHMSPTGVVYFADAHIKMGQPIYHMTAAAEILRTTSTTNPALEWTQQLTDNYINNFLTPQMDAYIRKNHYFMNQYSYALMGNTAAAIFADDTAAYEQAVEWTTVNATAENQGWNGSIKRVFRLMTHDDFTGEVVEEPYIQLAEMGRDQPHAIGNVDNLFIISQIIASQNTKVDPELGTISTASNAIDPVHFNGDALLKAFNYFAKYNVGYDVTWTPVASSILADGTFDSIYKLVNAQQRGRLTGNVYPALYHFFKNTVAGYDLTQGDNQYLQLAYEKYMTSDSGAIRSGGYWGPKEHVYDSEFWMHLPVTAADTSVSPRGEPGEVLDSLPANGPAHIVEIEKRHVLLNGVGQVNSEDDSTYLSIETSSDQPANFTLWTIPVSATVNGLRIRSNGTATIEFSRGLTLAASSKLHVPDTLGQWRYITFDRSKQDVGTSGDLWFFRVIGDSSMTTVDFDHLNNSSATLTPPVFESLSTNIVSYVNGSVERSFAATSLNTLSYSTDGNVPAGVSLNSATGEFSWEPNGSQQGSYRFFVNATDGEYVASHEVTLCVAASAHDAVAMIAQTLNPQTPYESGGRDVFNATQSAVLAAINAGDTSSVIDAALALFLAAADNIKLLSPVIAEDIASDELGAVEGSLRLDYPNVVAATNTYLGALVDGNAGSFNSLWGPTFIQLDFGANYRVMADAVHVQTRQGFPDRVQGGHLLASNDGINWARITDDGGYGEAMQNLPVYVEFRDQGFRYLKFATNGCDCPVFDLGELYIFGERKEINSSLASAPSLWFVDQPLEIQVNVYNPQSDPLAFHVDLPAGASFNPTTGLISWVPSSANVGQQVINITADYGYTRIEKSLPIAIYLGAEAAIDEILATVTSPEDYTSFSLDMLERAEADARAIAAEPSLSMEHKLASIALLKQAVALIEPKVGKIKTGRIATILASHQMWNNPAIGVTLSGLPAFDNDPTTFISLQNANGTWVQADFGQDNYASLTQVRLTPRPNYGLRLNGATITASNDGVTWTLLAVLPTDAYASNADNTPRTLAVADNSEYRYLRINGSNGSNGDVAEVEYFGTTNAGFDDRTLAYLLAKTDTLNASDWTAESWLQLTDAVAMAQVAGGAASTAEATLALDAALNALIPTSSNLGFDGIPTRWFVGQELEFSVYTDGVKDEHLVLNVDLPQGASFDPNTGVVRWTPSNEQLGAQMLRFTAHFDYIISSLTISLPVTISADANAAIDEILASIDATNQYSNSSMAMLARAEADTRAIVVDASQGIKRKLAYLGLLEKAVLLLEPYAETIDVVSTAAVLASHQQWNTPANGVAVSGLPAFDGNHLTYVDLQSANGTWVQADFGEGRHVQLTQVRLTPRQNYALRLNGATIQGSNDGQAWTVLLALPANTFVANGENAGRTFAVSDESSYRYLRFYGANSSHANVAGIEYIGGSNFEFDDRTLAYLIEKAHIFNENDWSEESWQNLQLAIAQAEMAVGEAAISQATEALDAALQALVPAPSYLLFSQASALVNEVDGSISLQVMRQGGSVGAASVSFATVEQSAVAVKDFVAATGSLAWIDGDMGSKTITISLVNDGFFEDTETFLVQLNNPVDASMGDIAEMNISITDDDQNGPLGISISDVAVLEGSVQKGKGKSEFTPMVFTVALSGTAEYPVHGLVRTYAGTARNGLDFLPGARMLKFKPGEKTKAVGVYVIPDHSAEDDEQLYLRVMFVDGAEFDVIEGVGTILNDD
jgi:hypothetical protein